MPIRPDLRHYYSKEWRFSVRPRILARADNRCERCRKPNRKLVETISADGWMVWRRRGGVWRDRCGVPRPFLDGYLRKYSARELRRRTVAVVLTVAHLNHDPSDNRDENLAALCQWCHLHHDQPHHKATRSERKDRARPLLAALGVGR